MQSLEIFGFAPGLYSGKCLECGCEFVGAKRSVRCLDCADNMAIKEYNKLARENLNLKIVVSEIRNATRLTLPLITKYIDDQLVKLEDED